MLRATTVGSVDDAALQQHRVGAGGHILQAFADDRLRQNGCGGGAIAGDVVGLGCRFLQQLGAHVFVRIFQFDLFGDGDAIMGHGRRAEFLVERDVSPFGSQSRGDSICDFINAALQLAASIFLEYELLCHGFLLIMVGLTWLRFRIFVDRA